MRIAFGADDENGTTEAVARAIREHHELVPVTEGSWPQLATTVAGHVAAGTADAGVVMCWTGTGTAMAANKVPGVRAAQATDAWTARRSRLWNDANVLALSLKRLAPDVAVECVEAFLAVEGPDEDELTDIEALKALDSSRPPTP